VLAAYIRVSALRAVLARLIAAVQMLHLAHLLALNASHPLPLAIPFLLC
jgi:hypothetical protein